MYFIAIKTKRMNYEPYLRKLDTPNRMNLQSYEGRIKYISTGKYRKVIGHRVNGRGCPYCANKKILRGDNDFATRHPELMRNGTLKKMQIYLHTKFLLEQVKKRGGYVRTAAMVGNQLQQTEAMEWDVLRVQLNEEHMVENVDIQTIRDYHLDVRIRDVKPYRLVGLET